MKSSFLLPCFWLLAFGGFSGCQDDPYYQTNTQKETLKDSIRMADSLNAIKLGDTIREIEIRVKEVLREGDSSQITTPD